MQPSIHIRVRIVTLHFAKSDANFSLGKNAKQINKVRKRMEKTENEMQEERKENKINGDSFYS